MAATTLFIFPLVLFVFWCARPSTRLDAPAGDHRIAPVCLPFALLGVWLRGWTTTWSPISFVVLIGLAAKNAVLIVEFSKQQEKEEGPVRGRGRGLPARLRPILMTSFAFILGVLPLARDRARRRDAPGARLGSSQACSASRSWALPDPDVLLVLRRLTARRRGALTERQPGRLLARDERCS
jgi:hypothetical protein